MVTHRFASSSCWLLVFALASCGGIEPSPQAGTGGTGGSGPDAGLQPTCAADEELVDGRCVSTAACEDDDCDDADACTEDDCDPETGCTNSLINCNDANLCTIDDCDSSSGCAYTPLDCDDDDQCTEDSCDPATGCLNVATDCNDGNLCTQDSCNSATGCSNVPRDCADLDPCTSDECNPTTGACLNRALGNGASCEHHFWESAVCVSGTCERSCFTATDCFDSRDCTQDVCVTSPVRHCDYPPVSDGSSCFEPSTGQFCSCSGGGCRCGGE